MLLALFSAIIFLATTEVSGGADRPRRIFGVGRAIVGGNAPHPLMNYALSLPGKPRPVIICLPTARGCHDLENDSLQRISMGFAFE